MADDDDAVATITSAPKRDQTINHDGKVFNTVQEGKAYILVPPNARTSLDPRATSRSSELADNNTTEVQNVFYNPIQQFNRDLSVLAIKAFSQDMCRRKEQKHALQRERQQGKRERKKRKRGEAGEEVDEVANSGAKSRKAENGSNVIAGDGEHHTKAEQSTSANIAEDEEDGGGVSLILAENEPVVTSADGGMKDAVTPEIQSSNTNGTQQNGSNAVEGQQEWRPRFRILDALSASGLRALRYAREIPSVTAIVANDRDRNAVKNIDLNVKHNQLSSLIMTSTGDALGHMYGVAFPLPNSHGPSHISGKYDVIDLDPYGTAAPFIDAALQALEDGGLLCVTCTDSGVFASCGYSEKTFALYGGMPIKGNHSHEGGLRLILQSIASSAAKYGMAIEPLLSLSIDFYVRMFIRVRKSPRDVKFLAGKTMLVYGCDHGCGAWSTQFLGRHSKLGGSGPQENWKYTIGQAPSADRLCEHCGSKTHVAGPMWGGPIHNPAFIERILDDVESLDEEVYPTKQRIEGMLTTALDELAVNSDTMDYRQVPTSNGSTENVDLIPNTPPEAMDHHPFFFIPSALCKIIKAIAPPENAVKGALRHAGYKVTRSHCKPGSIKTDAPWSVIWEVMREWVRQKSPIKEGALKEGSPGWKLLQGMRTSEGEHDQQVEENGANGGASDGDRAARNNTKRLKVIFDEELGKDKQGKRLVRYQMNPRENWGPMAKAKGAG